MWKSIKSASLLLIVMTCLTGLLYPMAVTGLAQICFPHQANGSLIETIGGKTASELIGQPFSDQKYFWGRPSATLPIAYNGASSAGSNLGPTNPVLVEVIRSRIAALQKADPENRLPIPVDLVTASGSGLDPHISLAAANYQVKRVARARGLDEREISDLVLNSKRDRQFGLLGEPTIHVLRLNLALDNLDHSIKNKKIK